MTCYVINFDNYPQNHELDVGGKAKNLFHLQKYGLPVPEFICVSADAFKACIKPVEQEVATLLADCHYDDIKQVAALSEKVKSLILRCELLPEISAQLQENMVSLQQWKSFSVRSSASNEDGLKSSFAGQLGTWLNVSPEQVEDKIKCCWASAFEPGILTYLHKKNLSHHNNFVAVVVQRMVSAESAGVLFQADPQGGVHKQVIAAGFGLGEGVVSDTVETDLYVYNKITQQWHLEINEKLRRLDCSPEGGTQEIAIEDADQQQAVLTQSQRDSLLESSAVIASIYDHYQDVEWAFNSTGQLYILQSRPITTVPKGFARVFDNSNIIESYPGVVLPMTFSILHLDYYHCIKDALSLYGTPKSVVAKYDDVLRHLVGYINGRSYYNISNWYRTLLLAPFFKKKIITYFEQMIGTDGSFDEGLDDHSITTAERLKLSVMFPLKFALNLINHDRLIRDYFSGTEKIRQEIEEIDLEACSSDEIIGYLTHFSKRFMKLLSIPILNDFFAMIFMAVTREQFSKSGIQDADNLLNKLLSNQQIESTKPVHSLTALVECVRENPALSAAVQEILLDPEKNTLEQITSQLEFNGFSSFKSQFKTHVDDFGHRSPKELIMEADTFRENPFHLLKIILASSQSESGNQKSKDNPERLFKQALTTAKKPRLLKWLLKKTRKAIAYREATRLDRGLHFSLFRTFLHHLGERLVEEGVLENTRDIFYVTLDELNEYRKGCTPNNDLKGLIRYRGEQAEQWFQQDQEEQIFTSGCVYANNFPDRDILLEMNDDVIQGKGCSSGEVTSEAKIISNPNAESDVKDKILVSETTDPGWVFLMTISAGLISERGSLLSHTAIIGRELGIPTIVGVKNATRYIQDGQTITMNGKTGTVKVHS